MGCIISFLTILNFLFWIVLDIIFWYLTGTTLGWIGLVGIFAFTISWSISGEATLSISDYIENTDFGLFLTKAKWANSATVVVMGILTSVFYLLDWCGMQEFLK